MKKQMGISFACIALVAVWMLACAPPPQTIYVNVTSEPSGAKVLYGHSKDAISTYLGVTPYSSSFTGEDPYWKAAFYRVEKKGYMPQTKYSAAVHGDRTIHFDLQPLPRFPTPPTVSYPEPESVAIAPLSLDIPEKNSFRMEPSSKVATMTFKQHEGSGAGALVADSLILNLQRMGYNVIDREMIENVLKEQNIMAEGKTNLTDLEVSKKIGQIFNADYFISGAITEYSAQSQNISLSPVIPEAEKTRYVEEYNRYVKFYQDEEITPPQIPKTIQEWELEYASRPKSSFISIAKVGITLKVVDIKTSRIVWVGIAFTSDLRLQEGMRRIVDGMIRSFTAAQRQPEVVKPASAPAPASAPVSVSAPATAPAPTRQPAAAAPAPPTPTAIPQESAPARARTTAAPPAADEGDDTSGPALGLIRK
ncbi:MAG TPA: CsgG/HfaB family protein [Desulfuromonadaceae bacterium]